MIFAPGVAVPVRRATLDRRPDPGLNRDGQLGDSPSPSAFAEARPFVPSVFPASAETSLAPSIARITKSASSGESTISSLTLPALGPQVGVRSLIGQSEMR